MLVIWGYASPDVARSDVIDHPIGAMYDTRTGTVEADMGRYDGKNDEHGAPAEH